MEVPSAVYVVCPECGEETLHSVLKGSVGTKKGFTLDATVRCETCTRVHHVVVREARDVEVPVIVSQGGQSRKVRITIPGDEEVVVGQEILVDGANTLVTGLETKDGKRAEKAMPDKLLTIWVKDYEVVKVKFAINLGKKTISKSMDMTPADTVHVGQEFTFGRLRMTVHAIKVKEKLLNRGTAEAGEIQRVFGKPTRLDRDARVFDNAREGARVSRLRRDEAAAPTAEEVLEALPDWEEDEEAGSDFEEIDEAHEPEPETKRRGR
ncbi:MAG TPA: HVO_0476 family zinc finger protein [Candidatus Thermoplasmatota archaeon]|nr:HVO_0476 family zinc finger protein [Candidatus Thermoplasmatota archaeon]